MVRLQLYKHVSQDLLDQNCKLPTFVALAFRNGTGYRYLNVCINSEMMPVYRVKFSWNSVH